MNIGITASRGGLFPRIDLAVAAGLMGFVGYGLSLVLFVRALRHVGAARTGAYFSLAPFAGLMSLGIWLHLSERHEHLHYHEPLAHTHRHAHDDSWDGTEPHTHFHVHPLLVHSHPHYTDLHHQHRH